MSSKRRQAAASQEDLCAQFTSKCAQSDCWTIPQQQPTVTLPVQPYSGSRAARRQRLAKPPLSAGPAGGLQKLVEYRHDGKGTWTLRRVTPSPAGPVEHLRLVTAPSIPTTTNSMTNQSQKERPTTNVRRSSSRKKRLTGTADSEVEVKAQTTNPQMAMMPPKCANGAIKMAPHQDYVSMGSAAWLDFPMSAFPRNVRPPGYSPLPPPPPPPPPPLLTHYPSLHGHKQPSAFASSTATGQGAVHSVETEFRRRSGSASGRRSSRHISSAGSQPCLLFPHDLPLDQYAAFSQGFHTVSTTGRSGVRSEHKSTKGSAARSTGTGFELRRSESFCAPGAASKKASRSPSRPAYGANPAPAGSGQGTSVAGGLRNIPPPPPPPPPPPHMPMLIQQQMTSWNNGHINSTMPPPAAFASGCASASASLAGSPLSVVRTKRANQTRWERDREQEQERRRRRASLAALSSSDFGRQLAEDQDELDQSEKHHDLASEDGRSSRTSFFSKLPFSQLMSGPLGPLKSASGSCAGLFSAAVPGSMESLPGSRHATRTGNSRTNSRAADSSVDTDVAVPPPPSPPCTCGKNLELPPTPPPHHQTSSPTDQCLRKSSSHHLSRHHHRTGRSSDEDVIDIEMDEDHVKEKEVSFANCTSRPVTPSRFSFPEHFKHAVQNNEHYPCDCCRIDDTFYPHPMPPSNHPLRNTAASARRTKVEEQPSLIRNGVCSNGLSKSLSQSSATSSDKDFKRRDRDRDRHHHHHHRHRPPAKTFFGAKIVEREEGVSLEFGKCVALISFSGVRLRRHHWLLLLVLLLIVVLSLVIGLPLASEEVPMSAEQRMDVVKHLLKEVPLIDGHNDLPWNIRKFIHNKLHLVNFSTDLQTVKPWSDSVWSHTDFERMSKGLVGAQLWVAYAPCGSQHKDAVQVTLEQIDLIKRLISQYPKLQFVNDSTGILEAHAENRLASLISVESGHSIGTSLAVLRMFHRLGAISLTLTHNCNTPWADCSSVDKPGGVPEHNGLSKFGKTVIKELNRLGMIIDLSHSSHATSKDAIQTSEAPVIFSHSSAFALCNSTRNVRDDVLKLLAKKNGLVMVNFFSYFLTCTNKSSINDVIDHLNHIRKVAGIDHVGIGASYDGINAVPVGLTDVSKYPELFASLLASGMWTIDDLKKLAGLNFIRVFKEVERVSQRLQESSIGPSEDHIDGALIKDYVNCRSVAKRDANTTVC